MTLRGKRTLGRVEQQDLTIICDEQAEVYSFVGSMIADLGIEGAPKKKTECWILLLFNFGFSLVYELLRISKNQYRLR